MGRRERAEAVREACARQWRDRDGDVFDVRGGRRLVFYQEPGFIVDDGGEVVGVDAWVRLYEPGGQEARIDPHRRIINPPTVPRAGVREVRGAGPDDVARVVTPDPGEAFWEAVWESVAGAPNPRGWSRTHRGVGTVTTVFGDTADGRIFSEDATTYATARTGGTLAVSTTGTEHSVGQEHNGSLYRCIEAFIAFDTSAITDTDVVSAVVLDMWLTFDGSTGAEFTVEVRDFDWGATLTTGDYISGANLGSSTLVSSIGSASIGATGAYKTFTSETAFKTVTNIKTGVVRLGLSSDRHRLGTAPGTSTQEFLTFSFADNAGTTQDPKLTITHGPGAPPLPPSTATRRLLPLLTR